MAAKNPTYLGNGAPSTIRGPSQVIWGDCPVESILEDRSLGSYFFDDFDMVGNAVMTSAYQGSLGQYSVYGSAGATISDAQLEGGVVGLQSDGTNEGITLQSSTGSRRILTTSTLALNPKLWFECRINRSAIVSVKGEFFCGLMSPLLTSGLPSANSPFNASTADTLLTTLDFIGFHCGATTGTRGGPSDVAVAFNLTSGTVNYPTNLTACIGATANTPFPQTLFTGTNYIKLGFIYDPQALPGLIGSAPTARQVQGNTRRKLIRFFVNGVELPTFLSSDDVVNSTTAQAFPTSFMTPVVASMNRASSAQPVINVDWMGCAQLANS